MHVCFKCNIKYDNTTLFIIKCTPNWINECKQTTTKSGIVLNIRPFLTRQAPICGGMTRIIPKYVICEQHDKFYLEVWMSTMNKQNIWNHASHPCASLYKFWSNCGCYDCKCFLPFSNSPLNNKLTVLCTTKYIEPIKVDLSLCFSCDNSFYTKINC